MLNRATIMGRMTQTPEIQTADNGAVYCSFSVAVSRDYITRDTGEREADFVDVIVWRGLAEFVSNNFDKGDPIIVDGPLRTKMLTRKDGSKVKSTTILADNCYFGSVRRPAPVSGYDPDEDGTGAPVEVPEETGNSIPECQDI